MLRQLEKPGRRFACANELQQRATSPDPIRDALSKVTRRESGRGGLRKVLRFLRWARVRKKIGGRAVDEQELNRLIADNQQNLARFLRGEVQAGLLYMRLAETEASLKDAKAARRAKDRARRAYETVVKFVPLPKSLPAEERQEIADHLTALRKLLEA